MKGGSEGQTEKRGQKRKRMGGHYRKYIHTPRLLPSREKQMTLEMHLPLHCPDFISFHISYIYIYNIFHFELVIFYIMVREYKMQLTLRHPTFCTRQSVSPSVETALCLTHYTLTTYFLEFNT